MDADEEARSRQYKGTAMSDDEVSKVHRIFTFDKMTKATNKKCSSLKYALYFSNGHNFFALCGAFFFEV